MDELTLLGYSPFFLAVALASYFGSGAIKTACKGKEGAAARFLMLLMPSMPLLLGCLFGALLHPLLPGAAIFTAEGLAKGISAGFLAGGSASKVYEQVRRKLEVKGAAKDVKPE